MLWGISPVRYNSYMITCQFENGTSANLRHAVVHALVEQQGKLLLVKRADGMLEGGKWALPGGFIDRDETAAQAVLRELREETGWTGTVLTLLQVNTLPDRPHEDRQNIAFDFVIRPDRQVSQPDQETAAMEWVPLDRLEPLDRYAFDHGDSIALYRKYRQQAFPAPVWK